MAPAGLFSFLKARRLTHRSEYERVKQNGITQRGRLLMLNAMLRGVQGSLLQGASAARSFAIASGVVCVKLFADTSTNCDKAFGL